MDEFGRVDVLVNNAGIGTAVPATRETPEQFRQVIDVNLNGCYWMAQACGRVMQPGSSIINISSVLGLTTAGLPQAAYASSKAGLIGMTRDLAQQWTGRKGIRVNAIAPGFFESEMTDAYPEGYLESQQPRIPVGRKGDPRELAATAVFLASDAAGYITGQTLPVDGGHDDHLTPDHGGRGRQRGSAAAGGDAAVGRDRPDVRRAGVRSGARQGVERRCGRRARPPGRRRCGRRAAPVSRPAREIQHGDPPAAVGCDAS